MVARGIIPFWSFDLVSLGTNIACADGRGYSLTYQELDRIIEPISSALRTRAGGVKQMGILLSDNTIDWLCVYLASLRASHVPLLLPFDIESGLLKQLINTYQPAWVWSPVSSQLSSRFSPESKEIVPTSLLGSFVWYTLQSEGILHPDLALLLSTSGSTGSPKLVRLSYQAITHNTESIAEYLDIEAVDKALTTLPPNYSYGMSVINSHLAVGATLVMCNTSLISRDFIPTVRGEQITSLAGVPAWYQMFVRAGYDKIEIPSLRVLTQAGGKLDHRTKKKILEFAQTRHLRFYVMYGQTEASPRMSYVPFGSLPDHLDSIGIPIPGGSFEIDRDTSELMYRGPNVMMGYAQSIFDLGLGDQMGGVLRTGDIGIVDKEGFYTITGRISRFVKLSGHRYSLDELETQIVDAIQSPVALVGRDECLGIWIEGADSSLVLRVKELLRDRYHVHHSLFRLHIVSSLPTLSNGKYDYTTLLQQLD